MKRVVKLGAIYILIIIQTLSIASCDAVPVESVKNGDCFRVYLDKLKDWYGVEFKSENAPIVNVIYETGDSTVKTATYQLDGFDSNKKIGYKLVLNKDKEEWDKERKNGNNEAPDMSDAELIQQASLSYQFPVIFMWIYQYQDKIDQDEISNNRQEFYSEFNILIQSPEIINWAEEGMYDGTWIKEYIEKECEKEYQINFSHMNLPTIQLNYGQNIAIFQLDGYDEVRGIGYKFVTESDAENWNNQLERGNTTVPDLSKANMIKSAALKYDYPIIFIYQDEYWAKTIYSIFVEEVATPISGELKQWLEDHN